MSPEMILDLEKQLLGVRRLVGALACGGLAPRSYRRLVADLTGAFSLTKLRLVAAGQSADKAAHSKELIFTKRPVDSSSLELQTGREFTY
jgi:hypothetical protein